MIVSIHQPHYWPWLGLLDKVAKSDIYVILDDVVINKKSNQRRNVFLCNGEAKYLTLSLDKFRDSSKINELYLKDYGQHCKHLEILRMWYKNTNQEEIRNFIQTSGILKNKYEMLSDLTSDTMLLMFKLLNIEVEVLRSSQIDYEGKKSDINLCICKALLATTYLSGKAARAYMSDDDFKKFQSAGINIEFQEFLHPRYHQSCRKNFLEGMSALDLIFNEGIEKSRKYFWDNVNEN